MRPNYVIGRHGVLESWQQRQLALGGRRATVRLRRFALKREAHTQYRLIAEPVLTVQTRANGK